MVKEGVFLPTDGNTEEKTILSIKEKTGFDNPVPDVNAPAEPVQPDLLIPIAVSLVIIVLGVVYAVFIRKS